MPLTDSGFVVKEMPEIRAELVSRIKDEYNDDVDVSDGSFNGKTITVAAEWIYDVQSDMQDVYDSTFLDTATGISLDRWAGNLATQRNLAQAAQVTLDITGTPGYLIEAETEFLTDNGDSFITADDAQIDQDGKISVIANSADMAAYTNVDANTIIYPANPVDEIISVNNPDAASGGADLETDYDLRHRLKLNLKAMFGPTIAGLMAAVMNVTAVTGVNIQQNLSTTVDANGNPPNTLHFYVSGGLPQDIAQAIADNIAAGAVTVGNEVYHIDKSGSDVEIHFDSAQSVNLSFKLAITEGDGYNQDALNEAVAEFLDTFDMGQTVILNKLYGFLYDLTGVDEVTNVQASLDGKTFTTDNIKLEKYQIAKTSDDLIEVTKNA